jgi:hypothetical protein
MGYDLDWVQDIVLSPIIEQVPGQTDMGFVTRTEDVCQCGGAMAYEVDDVDPMAVVARHNQSRRHREWREMGGLSLTTDEEMVGHVPIEMFPTDL